MGSSEFREKPTPVIDWNDKEKTLHVKTIHPLGELTGVSVQVNAGDISVTRVNASKSTLVNSFTVSKASEVAIRKEGEKRIKSLKIQNEEESLKVDGTKEVDVITDDEGITTLIEENKMTSFSTGKDRRLIWPEKGKRVDIDYSGVSKTIDWEGPIMINADLKHVTIDGKPLEPDDPALEPIPEVIRKVEIFVAKDNAEIPYRLETQLGNVSVKDVGGQAIISTSFGGNVELDGFKGKMRIDNRNGKTVVTDVEGWLEIHNGKEAIMVYNFKGIGDFGTNDGNITMTNSFFEIGYSEDGEIVSSEVRTGTGDIQVGTVNDSLIVSAQTKGDISMPKTFTRVDSTNAGEDGLKEVLGYIGTDVFPQNSIKLFSDTGDIILKGNQ